ncbi:MAG: hypothetical protein KJN92_11660, partial [Gemmatimonadetes bacterium]|nr:hypothetical protein [Gemmatimonadota bacterium]
VHEWLGVDGQGTTEERFFSQELADSVMSSVQVFHSGDGPDQLSLGAEELTSVLRYSISDLIPDGVADPEVTLKDGRIHFRSRVALTAFPELPDLGPILGMLPDTLDVTLEASLMAFGDREVGLLVHRVEASRIPLPGRLIPEILDAMGREPRSGLPPEALLFPLPRGMGSAYILTDSLIISRNP